MIGCSQREISALIVEQLDLEQAEISLTYHKSKDQIGYFIIDNLLPLEIANACYEAFPLKDSMKRKKSLREYKYVSSQMDRHSSILEDVLFAFQNKHVVAKIASICSIPEIYPDEALYAGGLSLMEKDNFLHPHLDNSHDVMRDRWRVLNLLYYVSQDWHVDYGGHLELWPNGPKKEPVVIESKFNRLVVMATHGNSWHSVSKVNIDRARCCISNYYYSNTPLKKSDAFHVTKFRGRPKSMFSDMVLTLDAELRMVLRKIFKNGIVKNPHIYKKDS